MPYETVVLRAQEAWRVVTQHKTKAKPSNRVKIPGGRSDGHGAECRRSTAGEREQDVLSKE